MKENETEYLNRLFAADVAEEQEAEFPMVDTPETLNEKLYAIAEPKLVGANTGRQGMFNSWPKLTSIAACLLVAIMGVQFYQQQQTLNQLERAQADLATALHYLGEANRITRAQVLESVNENVKAGVRPAMEVGRDAVLPNLKSTEETEIPTRTL